MKELDKTFCLESFSGYSVMKLSLASTYNQSYDSNQWLNNPFIAKVGKEMISFMINRQKS